VASRAFKIAGIILTVFLALIVLAVGALFVLASSDSVRDWALAKAKTELAAGPGLELKIQAVEGSLLSTLRFRELSVSQKGRTFFKVREAELGIHLLSLLGGRVKVSPLRLEEPSLALPLELDSAQTEDGAQLPLAISMPNIEIVRGRVYAAPGELGPLKSIESINAKGRFVLDMRGMRARVNLMQAKLEMPKGALEASAKARMRGQRVEMQSLGLKSGSTELNAGGWLDFSKALSFELNLKGRLADYELLPIAWPGTQLPAAPLGLEVSAAGEPEQCKVKADLNLAEGRIKAHGMMNLTVPDGQIELDFEQFDSYAWGLSKESIQASGKAKLSSQGKPGSMGQQADLDLTLSQLQVLKSEAKRLNLRARLENGVLHVKELDAEGKWGSFIGAGTLRLPLENSTLEVDAKLDFKNLKPPQALAQDLPSALVSPSLNGSLEAKGNSQDLTLALELDSSSLLNDMPVDSLSALGGLRGGAWWLSHLEARGDWGDVRAQGSLDKQKIDLTFDVKLADLAKVCGTLNTCGLNMPSLGGAFEAKGSMKGPWPSPQWELSAEAHDLAGYDIYMDNAEISAKGDSLMPLRGKVVLQAKDLASGEENWEKVRLELSAGKVVHDFNLQAHSYEGWDLSISADSPADIPLLEAITLRRFRLQKPGQTAWVQKGTAQLSIDQQGVSLDKLGLKAGEQSISISGGWKGRDNVQADLEVNRLRIKPFLPDNILPAEAELTASASLAGGLDRPVMRLNGRVAGLVWPGLPPSQVEFSGDYRDQLLELDGRAITRGKVSLNLAASLGINLSLHPPVSNLTPRGISAVAKTEELPLAIFEPLVPSLVDISGKANMRVTVTGDLDKPRFNGYVELDKAAFTVGPTGQRFEDIELALRLRDQKVEIQRASVRSGGAMDFSGWFDLPRAESGRLSLDMKAKDFDLSIGVLGDSEFDAALQARGTWQEPLISGTVKPTALRVQVGMGPPSALEEDVVIMKPGQKPPPMDRRSRSLKWVPTGVLGRARVDLTADLGKGLRVSLDEGWLEAVGDMQLKKEPKGPFTYHGVLQVTRGLVILLGKRFNILRGNVDFAGRDEPNPMVDAAVSLQAGKILARISVTGDAFNPHVQVSSEPPMSQADILSTIVFGRPAQNLDQGQSDQLSAQALALLGQRGAREIGQLLSPQLAPDVVTVHQEAQYGSSLEAGKYLSPDLYLRYRHNLSTEGGQNVGLEYRINDWFSVESQVGDARDSGVDMVYTFDFD
jgi:translocation and assembly module TamB